MVEEVKKRCYIVSDLYNDEIESLIKSCKQDLKDVGINENVLNQEKEVDGQLLNCIVNYVKAYRGNDRNDSEKYLKMYESLKNKISMQESYTEGKKIDE